MKAKEGIVCFIDILGYQNFIDNNTVVKAVEILDATFDGLKDDVTNDYAKLWTKTGKTPQRNFEALSIQTLSDSIILHLSSENGAVTNNDWFTMLQTARIIQRRLFDKGFPSRGAIFSGIYYYRDGFLVGKPFMEAYRLCQQLEFVGVALTPRSYIEFKKHCPTWRRYAGGVLFLAPLKLGKEEKLYCLALFRLNEIGTASCENVSKLVNSSFWKHGKDVAQEADKKVHNTVKFLTYWICRRETSSTKLS